MNIVCPTVLADTVEEYREQMATISPFANRIQIDLGDGQFTTKTVDVADVWWPEGITADIHLMYDHPMAVLPGLCALKPHMIILHYEMSDNLNECLECIERSGIKTGLALLQDTLVAAARQQIEKVDHVLIFSGSLGSFGGKADLTLLGKVPAIRAIQPDIEIGWDGGANETNIIQLVTGGIDVVNVGGAIQKATHPANAYRSLSRLIYR